MSGWTQLRASPAILRVGLAEAVAYRAELLVWILSTTMPLVMLALWSAVARDAPVGRYDERGFIAYFLATFVVRQLTSSWASWQINFEVRQGTLSMRLLKPFHPVLAYAIENLAALPMRLIVAVPVAIVALVLVGADSLPATVADVMITLLAIVGAWWTSFAISIAIGSLCFFMQQSSKVMDVYLAAFFVLSGYTIPIDLFPAPLRVVLDWLPFRFQIGFPVELLTGAHSTTDALRLLGRQWLLVAGLTGFAAWLWSRGLRRFEAVGG